MDHLPHPSEPYRPLRVPYIGFRFPYSGPFDDFPQRHNFSLSGGLRPRLQGPSPFAIASVAQSWLFFGLLEEFLGLFEIDIDIEDFLCDSKGHCVEEPDGLEQSWVDDEVIVRYSPHRQPETRTQAPRRYWMGIRTEAAATDSLDTQQSRFVTTKRLWWYLHAAIQKHQGTRADGEERALIRNRFDGFEKKQVLTGSVITGLNNLDTRSLEDDQKDAYVAIDLSLRALRETLLEAWFISEGKMGLEVTIHSVNIHSWMLRRGHCNYHAYWVVSHFSAQSAYYISLLWAPRPLIGTPVQTHDECSGGECRLLQIDENDYKVKHQPGCGGCRMLAPDIKEVSRILGGGGIPVIRVRTQSEHQSAVEETSLNPPLGVHDSIAMDVIPYQEGLVFYAVSHVWSDGLGNPHENALPYCQVRALSSAAFLANQRSLTADALHVESLPKEEEVFIWIDTLCIPLIREPRKQAIQRLRDTFASATNVLVLDADLEATKKQGRTTLELGYRILSCNWQRRMWTLQEAVFAHKLAFKFADGLVLFEDLKLQETGDSMKSVHMDLNTKLSYLCSGRYRAETFENVDQTARIHRLRDTVTNISHRTTSRLTDESICLATLLNADVGALLETPETQRMRYILDHQKGFAPSIIFINGPKMQESPYRWAPSTFLYPRWHRLQLMAGFSGVQPDASQVTSSTGRSLAATMTPHGLILDLPGLFICPSMTGPVTSSEFFAVDDPTSPKRLLLVRTICEDGGFSGSARPVITFPMATAAETPNSGPVAQTPGEGAQDETVATHAILLMAPLDAPMPGYSHLRPKNVLGLLISDIEKKRIYEVKQASHVTVISGRCEARVDVRDLNQDPEMLRMYSRVTTDEEGKVTGGSIHGTFLRSVMAPGFPKWCIR